MKFRIKSAIVIAAVSSLLVVGTIPASAASSSKSTEVKIAKIGTKKVAKKTSTVKLAPKVTAGSKTKVTSKKITVKKGSKTLAKNVSSYKAKPGTYKVTTTVKYKLKTTKKTVVTNGAGNTKKIKMKCTVVNTETYYDYEETGVDLEYFQIECRGDAFDGVYKANAAYVYQDSWLAEYMGEMIWGESFPSEPVFFPIVGYTFNVTAVPQDGKLYKTTTSWSKEKTVKKTETVKVIVKK